MVPDFPYIIKNKIGPIKGAAFELDVFFVSLLFQTLKFLYVAI